MLGWQKLFKGVFLQLGMVFGGKQLEDMQAQVAALADAVASQRAVLDKLVAKQDALSEQLSSEIVKLQNKQTTALGDFTAQVEHILALNTRYSQGISSLQKVKSDLSNLMYETALQDTKALVGKSFDELSGEFSSVKAVSGQLAVVKDAVTALQTEVAKFSRMSASVKEIDTQLVNYVREITAQDKEKLELMREVDRLQTLVAKMRRR